MGSSIDLACLFRGNSSIRSAHHRGGPTNYSWRFSTIVVPALWREWRALQPPTNGPPIWLPQQYDVYLYQRTESSGRCYLPNMAFESGVYLHFIVEHWASLPAYTAFVQADWFLTVPGTLAYPPVDFWQPACARLRGVSWLPIGKRWNRWPPYTVMRDSTFWEIEPTARPLAQGTKNIASLVERCSRDLLDDFEIARPDVPRLKITFFPYMNFVSSRASLQAYPLRVWRLVRDRLMHEGVCLHDVNSSAASRPDNPSFSKIHASVMEMLQDPIFGRCTTARLHCPSHCLSHCPSPLPVPTAHPTAPRRCPSPPPHAFGTPRARPGPTSLPGTLCC